MTAAISDASTFLSAACWRMMSSWRSGSLISCTALSAGRTRLSTATMTTARPAASIRRRRSTRALDGWWRAAEERRAVAGWALISGRHLRKNLRQLLLEFSQSAGVLYSVGRPRGFLLLCQLPGCPFVQGLVPTGAGSLGAD